MSQRLTSYLLALLIPCWLFAGVEIASAASPPDSMHTIFLEQEDAVGAAHATKTRFEGYHAGTAADPYLIDADFEQMAGNSGGFIVFREQDPENFYQLDLRANASKIQNKVNGVYNVVASVAHGFGAIGHEYRIRLVLADNTISVYDRDLSLTTPILEWTDPENSHPAGFNVSYYAKPGSEVCWTRVSAHPQSSSPFLNAWDLPGVGRLEGYLSGQDKSGNPSIGSARYDFTFDNYSSGAFSQAQGGAGGTMEYAFEATSYGAALAYRVRSSLAHMPASGYEVRQDADGVQWGTLDSSGHFILRASGPPVVPGTRIRVLVAGDVHSVVSAGGLPLLEPQTDASYSGLRTFFGFYSGAGVIRGYQLAA